MEWNLMFNFVLEEVRDNNSPIAWEAVAYKVAS